MRSSLTLRDGWIGRSARVTAGIIVAAIAAGCSSSSEDTASLAVSSGNGQTGTVATNVTAPLVVQVKDQNGNAMSGVLVSFAASGGATLGSSTATSDASGYASTTVTLGTRSGTDTVTASAANVPGHALFTLTANAGAPAGMVVVSGNNQTAASGSTLANAMVVEVQDQYGNAVSGTTVDWTTTAGLVVGTGQSTSDANGTASAALQLPNAPTAVVVTATVHGTVIVALFSETAT